MAQSKKSLSPESTTDAVVALERELLPVSEMLLRVEKLRTFARSRSEVDNVSRVGGEGPWPA